jgi:hypothetical protein
MKGNALVAIGLHKAILRSGALGARAIGHVRARLKGALRRCDNCA